VKEVIKSFFITLIIFNLSAPIPMAHAKLSSGQQTKVDEVSRKCGSGSSRPTQINALAGSLLGASSCSAHAGNDARTKQAISNIFEEAEEKNKGIKYPGQRSGFKSGQGQRKKREKRARVYGRRFGGGEGDVVGTVMSAEGDDEGAGAGAGEGVRSLEDQAQERFVFAKESHDLAEGVCDNPVGVPEIAAAACEEQRELQRQSLQGAFDTCVGDLAQTEEQCLSFAKGAEIPAENIAAINSNSSSGEGDEEGPALVNANGDVTDNSLAAQHAAAEEEEDEEGNGAMIALAGVAGIAALAIFAGGEKEEVDAKIAEAKVLLEETKDTNYLSCTEKIHRPKCSKLEFQRRSFCVNAENEKCANEVAKVHVECTQEVVAFETDWQAANTGISPSCDIISSFQNRVASVGKVAGVTSDYREVQQTQKACDQIIIRVSKEIHSKINGCRLKAFQAPGGSSSEITAEVDFERLFEKLSFEELMKFSLYLLELSVSEASASLGSLSSLMGENGMKSLAPLFPGANSLLSNFRTAPVPRMIMYGAEATMSSQAADQFQADEKVVNSRVQKLAELRQQIKSRNQNASKAATLEFRSANQAKSAGSSAALERRKGDRSLVDSFFGDGNNGVGVNVNGTPLFDCFRGESGKGNCQSVKPLFRKLAKNLGRDQLNPIESDLATAIDGTVGRKKISKDALAAIERNSKRADQSVKRLRKFQQRFNKKRAASGETPIDFQKQEKRFNKKFNKAIARDIANAKFSVTDLTNSVLDKIAQHNLGKKYKNFVNKAKRLLGRKSSNPFKFSSNDGLSSSKEQGDDIEAGSGKIQAANEEMGAEDQYELNDNASIEQNKFRSIFDIITGRYFKKFY
jgi:hypothetical protein